MNEIVKALEQMESRIVGHVDRRMDELRVEINGRIDEVHTRIDEVHTRIDEVDRRIDELRAEMNQRFDAVHDRIDELENNQIELLARHAEKQNVRMNIMQLQFDALTKRVEAQEYITKQLL